MDYCRHQDCIFSDCEYHQDRAPIGMPYDVEPMDEGCEKLAAHMREKAEIQERVRTMTYGKAFNILLNLEDPETPDELKGAAIRKAILRMETHNAVTKNIMLKVIRYLFGLCFEEVEG